MKRLVVMFLVMVLAMVSIVRAEETEVAITGFSFQYEVIPHKEDKIGKLNLLESQKTFYSEQVKQAEKEIAKIINSSQGDEIIMTNSFIYEDDDIYPDYLSFIWILSGKLIINSTGYIHKKDAYVYCDCFISEKTYNSLPKKVKKQFKKWGEE